MHFTLCTSLYALHSMHFTLCTSLYALDSVHFTLCTSLYALHSMHFTLCASLYALHSVHLTLCTSLYALHSVRFTLCTSLYALRSMRFTLCTSLYVLHSMLLGQRAPHGRTLRDVFGKNSSQPKARSPPSWCHPFRLRSPPLLPPLPPPPHAPTLGSLPQIESFFSGEVLGPSSGWTLRLLDPSKLCSDSLVLGRHATATPAGGTWHAFSAHTPQIPPKSKPFDSNPKP